jgi:hypothetical protein
VHSPQRLTRIITLTRLQRFGLSPQIPTQTNRQHLLSASHWVEHE